MSAVVLRGDAAHLPLPDESVDLIVTSPPYFGLRSYSDNGEHYDGQIGSEATPREYMAALVECMREWVRVLKPSGSIFVNLGDKYSGYTNGQGKGRNLGGGERSIAMVPDGPVSAPDVYGVPNKSLMGLPWRYALACMDDLGLILRAEIVWQKPNGLPESVQDRVRRSHEQVFHFTRQPRYYAAVDEIREPHMFPFQSRTKGRSMNGGVRQPEGFASAEPTLNPLGKLPGSVWPIPSQPLTVPARLGVDHFAAYPPELCRRIILGWSPPGICVECDEGRRPVSAQDFTLQPDVSVVRNLDHVRLDVSNGWSSAPRGSTARRITGYACACTPYTDHPGGTGRERTGQGYARETGRDAHPHGGVGMLPRTGPWREHHFEGWSSPPTRPAVVVDPFAGTGTTMLTASILGRIGIGVDRSADYCRLATWRCSDPGERARALGVPKPPPISEGQASLFDQEAS